MTKYDATLTTAVRINGVRQEPGAIVEVDDALLEELEKHGAVTNVAEKKAIKKPPAKKPVDKTEGAARDKVESGE